MIEEHITNPKHPIPEELAKVLRELREVQKADWARQEEMSNMARPTKEELRAINEIKDKALGLTLEQRTQLQDISTRYTKRVRGSVKVKERNKIESYTTFDIEPAEPVKDPLFWWAITYALRNTSEIKPSFDKDGLWFQGTIRSDDQDTSYHTFTAKALFELHQERIPESPTGRWLSAPSIELFGGLLAHTGAGEFHTGDCWSKCWIHRHHTVYQHGFGEIKILGEAWAPPEQILDEENASRSMEARMRGFQLMPPVVFSGMTPGSVWAEVEVGFVIQLEGSASMWTWPSILIRTPQWRAVAY